MNVWVALIIGLIIGWLLELAVDVFYWRKRRLCPDDSVMAVQAQLDKAEAANGRLQTELNGRDSQIAALEGNIEGWRGELNGLNEESKGLGIGTIFPNGDLKLGGFIAALRNRFSQFRTELEGKDAKMGSLNAALHQKDAEILQMQNDLAHKDAELVSMRTELEGLDQESDRLGLGSLFAGGSLAVGGFMASLRKRFDRDEQASTDLDNMRGNLDTAESNLTNLRGELALKEARIQELEGELNGRNQELTTLRNELSELDNEMDGLGLGKLTAAGGGGLALGGFLASLRDRFDGDDEDETAVLNTQINDLQVQLDECHGQLAALQNEVATTPVAVADQTKETPPVVAAVADQTKEAPPVVLSGPSGLSMVWGLNTQTSDMLASQGITSYSQLGASSQADVEDALTASQSYYPNMDNSQIHGLWVEQSRFANSGDWNGLLGYQQANLDLASRKDDLKKLWGIGPKIEQVMNNHGIYLFAQLASVPSDRITEILRSAGSRFRMSTGKLHESWPTQARLADNDEWDELKELTDSLTWSNVN